MAKTSRRDLLAAAGFVGSWTSIGPADLRSTVTAGVTDRQDAVDWRMFQRDASNGGHVPAPGPAVNPRADWQYETDKSVRGPVAVVDGTVYAGSMDGHLYAIESGGGRLDWRYETTEGVSASPAVVDGTVYVVDWDAVVHAVDATSGDAVWTRHLGGDFHTAQPSPTVDGGRVYAGNDVGELYALDVETGEQRWTVQIGETRLSTSAVRAGVVFVGSDDGAVYALDAETGERQWAFRTDGPVESAPAAAGEDVFVGSDDGVVYALDAAAGKPRWSYDAGEKIRSSPAVVGRSDGDDDGDGGTVYVGGFGGTVHALDVATGEPRWTRSVGTDAISSPTVGNQTVYLGRSGLGNLAVALDATTGEVRWSVGSEASFSSAPSPAVVGRRLYVGGHGNDVHAVTGEPLATPSSVSNTESTDTRTPSRDDDVAGGTTIGDLLEGWYPLLAWLVGVPFLGPLILGALVAVTDPENDESTAIDPEDEP